MHMRGDPGSMQSTDNTSYVDVCTDVGRELQQAADAAMRSGIEPWRLILDPGGAPLIGCCPLLSMLKSHQTASFRLCSHM